MPLIPWAILQLDTIKAVIHDLGLAHLTSRTARKNDLVKLLYSIDIEGLSPVRKRLQATAARDAFSSNYLPEETPELEYAGPGPSTSSASTPASARVRPIVEIPVHIPIFPPSDEDEDEVPVRVSRRSRPPRTRASLKGKARARSSPSSDSEDDPENSSLPPPRPSRPASSTGTSLSRVGPPTKKTRRSRPPLATTTTTTTTTTTSVSGRAGPPSRRRARAEPAPESKLPPIDLSKIPPPSYAILYEQLHNIGKPRRTPWPRLNPHETFAGVDVPLRKGKRKRTREEDEDEDEDADAEQSRAREGEGDRSGGASSRAIVSEGPHSVNGSEELGGAARGRGTRDMSTGTGTGTAVSTTGSVTRRMEAVVVSSSKTLKAKTATSGHRRKTIVMSDDEIEFWV